MTELLADFLSECGAEKNWNDIAKEKYTQAVNHLIKAVPRLKLENITLETMLKLRKWYSDNEFRNRTVSKQLTMLKAFLRWVNDQKGYSIPEKALNFSPHLKVARKTVTFLNYEELMHFINAPLEKEHIQLARDLWCFMALTSLRFSDLANLKVGHINENRIEMLTQKTSDRITIPLTEPAISIYEKYKEHPTKDGHIFPVPSNQKLNDYIKIAAKEAGIDRMIVDTFFLTSSLKK